MKNYFFSRTKAALLATLILIIIFTPVVAAAGPVGPDGCPLITKLGTGKLSNGGDKKFLRWRVVKP